MQKKETIKRLLISIIIPVFNTEEKYLRKCLKPFLQNYDPRIEIILVDDGSDEPTRKILCDLASQCRNEIHVIYQENGGQNAARNAGIEISQAEYIEFLDSDDYIVWEEEVKILDTLENHNPDILGINTSYVTMDGHVIAEWNYSKNGSAFNVVDKFEILGKCSALWQQIVRRSLFHKAGIKLLQGIYIGRSLVQAQPQELIGSHRRVAGGFFCIYIHEHLIGFLVSEHHAHNRIVRQFVHRSVKIFRSQKNLFKSPVCARDLEGHTGRLYPEIACHLSLIFAFSRLCGQKLLNVERNDF